MPSKSRSRSMTKKRSSASSRRLAQIKRYIASVNKRKAAKIGAAGAGTLGALLLARYLHQKHKISKMGPHWPPAFGPSNNPALLARLRQLSGHAKEKGLGAYEYLKSKLSKKAGGKKRRVKRRGKGKKKRSGGKKRKGHKKRHTTRK